MIKTKVEIKAPQSYMSKSAGFYRVISQGFPVCNDKSTEQEALTAAKRTGTEISNTLAWDGDAGQWYNPGY